MAVRRSAQLVGAAAVALLIGFVGPPAVDAQEEPAAPAVPTTLAAPSIRDALTGGSTAVTGTAAGGFDGGDTLDVILTLENHTAAPIQLTVPRGALFETDDETQQTAVTAGPNDEVAADVQPGVDPVISVAPGTNTIELAGFCAQHLDSGPDAIVPMTWAGVAEDPLPKVLENIVASGASAADAQHAVWWVTDVPVLPVPDEVAPLLDGVDAEAFAAKPRRVVPDEQYTPAWGHDQALDPDDPFGEAPFGSSDPFGTGDDDAFAVPGSDGSDGGMGLSLFLAGAVLAAIAIVVVVARTSGRQAPALVRTDHAATGVGTGPTPPGWHPDPQNPWQHRYWDGSRWTDQTSPR